MKYLFCVRFKDGTIYVQNPEDISVEDKTRSCFFDIQKQINADNPPEIFTLEDKENLYVVDLTTGIFEINGVQFSLHNEPLPGPFRLVYFRRHTHKLNIGAEAEHSISYNFGWQTTHNGENIQRIITVN